MGHPEPAAPTDSGLSDLWQLDPTWSNIEMILHRLWGRRVERAYTRREREELSVLRELLSRRRQIDHG